MNRRSFVGLLGAAIAAPAAALGIVRTQRKPERALAQDPGFVPFREAGRSRLYSVPKGRIVTDWHDPSQWVPHGVPEAGDTIVVAGFVAASPSRPVNLKEVHVLGSGVIGGGRANFLQVKRPVRIIG